MLDIVLGKDTFKKIEKTLHYVADSITYRFPHKVITKENDIRVELENISTIPVSIKTSSVLKADSNSEGANNVEIYLNEKIDQQKSEAIYIQIILDEINDLQYIHKYIIINFYLESDSVNNIISNLQISKSSFYQYRKEALMILALCLPENCTFKKKKIKGGEKNEL